MFEKMFEMLEDEARVLCVQIVEKSKGEAEKIVEEAELEAKKIVQMHIDKMDVALRGESARIMIEAELEKKRKIIHVKEESTAKVYAGIEDKLKDIRGNKEEYKKVVRNLLLESLNKVRGNKIQVIVDKRDQELLHSILRELNLNHEVTAGNDSIGGISLSVDGSRILVYNTLESRLEKAKQILKAQLNEVLFGDRQTADSIG